MSLSKKIAMGVMAGVIGTSGMANAEEGGSTSCSVDFLTTEIAHTSQDEMRIRGVGQAGCSVGDYSLKVHSLNDVESSGYDFGRTSMIAGNDIIGARYTVKYAQGDVIGEEIGVRGNLGKVPGVDYGWVDLGVTDKGDQNITALIGKSLTDRLTLEGFLTQTDGSAPYVEGDLSYSLDNGLSAFTRVETSLSDGADLTYLVGLKKSF